MPIYGSLEYGSSLYSRADINYTNQIDMSVGINGLVSYLSDIQALIPETRVTNQDISIIIPINTQILSDIMISEGLRKSFLSDFIGSVSNAIEAVVDQTQVIMGLIQYKSDISIDIPIDIIINPDIKDIISRLYSKLLDTKVSSAGKITVYSDTSQVFDSGVRVEVRSDMTMKVWTNALINNTDLGQYNFILGRDTERDLLSNITVRMVELPDRDGAILLGKDLDERELQLVLFLICDTEEDYLAAKRVLAGLICDDIDLVFEDQPNRHYFCRYAGNISLQEWVMSGSITLPLKMPDPYVYSDEKIKVGVGTITNQGTEPADMLISVTGPAFSPWTINIGGDILTINVNLTGTNDILTIDTKSGEMLLNGSDIVNKIDGDLDPLAVGDTLVSCSVSTITIKWCDKWSLA